MGDKHEYKTFHLPAQVKIEKETEDEGLVRCIFAVIGNIDEGRNRLMPGFFTKSIAERAGQVRVLDNHQSRSITDVLGKPLEIREIGRDELPEEISTNYPDATGGYEAVTRFNLEKQAGREAFSSLKNGEVGEWSIGYDLLESDEETLKVSRGEYGFRLDADGEEMTIRNERVGRLLEYSPVVFAMNPATTTTAAKEKPDESKPVEETEDSIRIRVFDPEKCQENTFRTITMSADDGIKAVICKQAGQTKTSVQVVIFDKGKGWTVAKAQAWVDSHDLSDAGKEGEAPSEVKFSGSPRSRYGTHGSYGFKGDYAAAWRCHFSKVGGGALTGTASGPLRGTVRRTEMIAAGMKPKCNLPGTDSIGARSGPKSPLDCSFPSKPSDYGLSSWDKPEGEEERDKVKLSCKDLAVIKRAALAEVKWRAEERERREEGGKSDDPILLEFERIAEEEGDAVWVEFATWRDELPDSLFADGEEATQHNSALPTADPAPPPSPVEMASLGDALSGNLFQFAALLLDDMRGKGQITRDQSVQLSGLIGKALGGLTADIPDAVKAIQVPDKVVLVKAGNVVRVSPVQVVEGEQPSAPAKPEKQEAGPPPSAPTSDYRAQLDALAVQIEAMKRKVGG